MRLRTIALLAAAVASLLSIETLSASGLVGIYGIVERVVFEPNATAPERVQVWGAFVYVDRAFDAEVGVSNAKRGYLYFTLPRYPQRTNELEIVRREWADLRASNPTRPPPAGRPTSSSACRRAAQPRICACGRRRNRRQARRRTRRTSAS
jgi:hypothetical protein